MHLKRTLIIGLGALMLLVLTGAPAERTAMLTIPVGAVDPADPTVKPLLGVISGPDPNGRFSGPNLTVQYQDIGVLSVRNNDYYDDRLDMEGIFNCGGPTYPSWEGCDPQDEANYRWGPSDAQFQSYLSGGFEPFLRLGGEWSNQRPPHDFKGPQNTVQEDNWIVAAQKVAARYLHWGGATQTFSHLDLWTEFPGTHFWDRSGQEFIAFWVKAYVALKSAFPQLKIGGPGFVAGETMKVLQGNARWSRELLTELFDRGLKLDWLGWHLFSNDPRLWPQAAEAYRQLLDGSGPYAEVPWAGTGYFSQTEVIVDAYGLSKRNPDGSVLSAQERRQLYDGAQGASLLTSAWITLQYAQIERAYYYRGSPLGGSGGQRANSQQDGGPGLFDAQGGYKPDAYAFRLWSQLYRQYPHLLQAKLPAADPDIPLWVLAAQDDQKDTALLIANPAASSTTWTPTFADGTSLEDYQGQLYQVDDQGDGHTAVPLEGEAVTTPGYSVQLLLLAPR